MSKEASFWILELLLLACLAGGAGDNFTQEVRYYQGGSLVARGDKWKIRYIHTVLVEAEEYVGRLRWIRDQRNIRASLIVQRRKEGKRKGETLQLVVTVPAC